MRPMNSNEIPHHNGQSVVRRRFSLIELLVVTGVIAILAGMLMPALTKARAKAVEANIANSVRQLHLALLMYYDDDKDDQFILNTFEGEKVGVDFTELVSHGFIPKMMDDPFRTIPLEDDPALTLALQGLAIDGTTFHSSGSGLLYFNFRSTRPDGNPIMTLAQFNSKFEYELPDDTQYVVIGVGMNGRLDPGKPIDDFVYIKREDNSNNERWPTN